MQKLIQNLVNIKPCNIGYGYFYKGQCFAYVWAGKAFSDYWWSGLILFANVSDQDVISAAEKIKKKNRKKGGMNGGR